MIENSWKVRETFVINDRFDEIEATVLIQFVIEVERIVFFFFFSFVKNVSYDHNDKIHYFFWFIYDSCRCVFFFIFTAMCFQKHWCFKIDFTDTFIYLRWSCQCKILYCDMIHQVDWQYCNVKNNEDSIKMIFVLICQDSMIENDKSVWFWTWDFFYLLRHYYTIRNDRTFHKNF